MRYLLEMRKYLISKLIFAPLNRAVFKTLMEVIKVRLLSESVVSVSLQSTRSDHVSLSLDSPFCLKLLEENIFSKVNASDTVTFLTLS